MLVTDDKMDPMLEIWVDDGRSPVVVRLVGTFDDTTSTSLLSVMGDLLREGVQQSTIEMAGVEIVAPEAPALALGQRWAREEGASICWDGVRFGQPVRSLAWEEGMVPC